jgi:hypothetical protein
MSSWKPLAGAALGAAVLASALGGARADTTAGPFPTIAESNWTGMRFIILPQSRAVQHYGYQEMYRDSDKEFVPLPYAEFAGRIVRVTGIAQGHGPNGETLDEADLQLEDDKKTIHGDIDHGCMEDAAPVSDLDTARTLYRGKTLWLASDHVSTYDPAKDLSDSPAALALHEAFGQVKLKQYSPVRVLDVVPGWYASAPVRFIVQDEATGAAGYVDVHMSDTNVPKNLQAVSRFRDVFLENDPRIAYPWPAKIWTAIENKEVLVGMTATQVQMSWGVPKIIRRTNGEQAEQWAYAANYTLTLKNGVLTAITKQ